MNGKPTADEKLRDFFQNQVTALKILYDKRLHLPALMLLYATLDITAFIRIGGNDREAGMRFRDFASRYFVKHVAGATESDLWGARCAVLHTATPESSSSTKGIAREFLYCWGSGRKSLLDKIIAKKGETNKYVAVSIEELLIALGYSIDEFLKELENDGVIYKECMERVEKFYVEVPTQ